MVLTFDQLRAANVDRCNRVFHPLEAWSLTDWGNALGGEVGEAQNILKKIRRGDFDLEAARRPLADELADVIAYTDLLAARAKIDLGAAVVRKFNEVSAKRGSIILLRDVQPR